MTDTTEKFPPRVIVNQYGVKLTGDNPPDKEVLAAMMVWDTEYLSTQEHLSTLGKLTRENGKLRGMLVEALEHGEQIGRLKEMIRRCEYEKNRLTGIEARHNAAFLRDLKEQLGHELTRKDKPQAALEGQEA